MGIAPQVHDVSTTVSDSCNCCDGCRISCCFPFSGRSIRANVSDIRVVRTADEALQKNTDSPPVASPLPAAASAPVIAMHHMPMPKHPMTLEVPMSRPSSKNSLHDLD